MNVLHNKKAIDTRAVNLLIAIPIIVICLIFFYKFAGDKLSVGKNTLSESDIAIIKLDLLIAEYEKENLQKMPTITPQELFNQLTSQLQNNGYKSIAVDEYDPNNCTGSTDITCAIYYRSPYTEHKKTYYREIIVPTTNGIRTITIKGELFA